MALIKREPGRTQIDPFGSLRGEVDRLFDLCFRGCPRPWASGWPGPGPEVFCPAVDLRETDEEYVITAQVPGFSKEKLDVTVAEDSVTITGDREKESEHKKEGYYFRESSGGSFQRVIPLPGRCCRTGPRQSSEDGVLTLTLPKARPAATRGVKIDVG